VKCTDKESIELDFQSFVYNTDEETTTIKVRYYGTCGLKIDFFEKNNIHNGILTPNTSKVVYGNTVLLTSDYHSEHNLPRFFRIIAENEMGVCSDKESQETFYHLEGTGTVQ
jgi:hypothetical protein